MIDILDMLENSFDYPCAGVYFEKLPEVIPYIETPEQLFKIEAGVPFDFKRLTGTEKNYKSLLGNMMSDGETTAIMTQDQINFKNRSFVLLDDGVIYSVKGFTTDTSDVKPQALRMFPVPIGTHFILQLVVYDDGGRL